MQDKSLARLDNINKYLYTKTFLIFLQICGGRINMVSSKKDLKMHMFTHDYARQHIVLHQAVGKNKI